MKLLVTDNLVSDLSQLDSFNINLEKISKSLGNGISVDEWLRYASPESLSLYMFQKPKSAKKLHFDVIPKTVDDYLSHYNSYSNLDNIKKLDSPIWHCLLYTSDAADD